MREVATERKRDDNARAIGKCRKAERAIRRKEGKRRKNGKKKRENARLVIRISSECDSGASSVHLAVLNLDLPRSK